MMLTHVSYSKMSKYRIIREEVKGRTETNGKHGSRKHAILKDKTNPNVTAKQS